MKNLAQPRLLFGKIIGPVKYFTSGLYVLTAFPWVHILAIVAAVYCDTMAIGNALLRESQSNDWPQRLLRGRRTIGSDNDLLDPVSETARTAKTESLEFSR
jgi:hypothetical protein